MAERMRSNKSQISAYDEINTTNGYSKPQCTICAPADIADIDKFEWSQKIKTTTTVTGLIPSAKGTVTEAAGIYTIEITWQADGATVSKYSIRVVI